MLHGDGSTTPRFPGSASAGGARRELPRGRREAALVAMSRAPLPDGVRTGRPSTLPSPLNHAVARRGGRPWGAGRGGRRPAKRQRRLRPAKAPPRARPRPSFPDMGLLWPGDMARSHMLREGATTDGAETPGGPGLAAAPSRHADVGAIGLVGRLLCTRGSARTAAPRRDDHQRAAPGRHGLVLAWPVRFCLAGGGSSDRGWRRVSICSQGRPACVSSESRAPALLLAPRACPRSLRRVGGDAEALARGERVIRPGRYGESL